MLSERIRAQAQAKNRLTNVEVITLLDRALAEAERSQAAVLDCVRRRRFFHPTAIPLQPRINLP